MPLILAVVCMPAYLRCSRCAESGAKVVVLKVRSCAG